MIIRKEFEGGLFTAVADTDVGLRSARVINNKTTMECKTVFRKNGGIQIYLPAPIGLYISAGKVYNFLCDDRYDSPVKIKGRNYKDIEGLYVIRKGQFRKEGKIHELIDWLAESIGSVDVKAYRAYIYYSMNRDDKGRLIGNFRTNGYVITRLTKDEI